MTGQGFPDATFSFEFLFALAVMILLANLLLLIRIRFGDLLVTHLSVKPYIVSLALFGLMACEFLSLSFLYNVSYRGDPESFWADLCTLDTVMRRIYSSIAVVKIDLAILFILFRARE